MLVTDWVRLIHLVDNTVFVNQKNSTEWYIYNSIGNDILT